MLARDHLYFAGFDIVDATLDFISPGLFYSVIGGLVIEALDQTILLFEAANALRPSQLGLSDSDVAPKLGRNEERRKVWQLTLPRANVVDTQRTTRQFLSFFLGQWEAANA